MLTPFAIAQEQRVAGNAAFNRRTRNPPRRPAPPPGTGPAGPAPPFEPRLKAGGHQPLPPATAPGPARRSAPRRRREATLSPHPASFHTDPARPPAPRVPPLPPSPSRLHRPPGAAAPGARARNRLPPVPAASPGSAARSSPMSSLYATPRRAAGTRSRPAPLRCAGPAAAEAPRRKRRVKEALPPSLPAPAPSAASAVSTREAKGRAERGGEGVPSPSPRGYTRAGEEKRRE